MRNSRRNAASHSELLGQAAHHHKRYCLSPTTPFSMSIQPLITFKAGRCELTVRKQRSKVEPQLTAPARDRHPAESQASPDTGLRLPVPG